MKFPWWRMVRGRLQITGRRLDAPAPPLLAYVPDGYGPIGFQATGVKFPTEGCWEVTGTVGQANLTFVTFVIKRERARAQSRVTDRWHIRPSASALARCLRSHQIAKCPPHLACWRSLQVATTHGTQT